LKQARKAVSVGGLERDGDGEPSVKTAGSVRRETGEMPNEEDVKMELRRDGGECFLEAISWFRGGGGVEGKKAESMPDRARERQAAAYEAISTLLQKLYHEAHASEDGPDGLHRALRHYYGVQCARKALQDATFPTPTDNSATASVLSDKGGSEEVGARMHRMGAIERVCARREEEGFGKTLPLWSPCWLPQEGIPEEYVSEFDRLRSTSPQDVDLKELNAALESLLAIEVQSRVEAHLLSEVVKRGRVGEPLQQFWELWRTTHWLATGEPRGPLPSLIIDS